MKFNKDRQSVADELRNVLLSYRQEVYQVVVLSMLANVLMLAPTLYMLQVYDRVTISGNELTLISLSIFTLGLFCVAACAEWLRSRILVNAGIGIDRQLSSRTFIATFYVHLNNSITNPSRAFADLIQLRQFLTGSGLISFIDAPWTLIYLAILFLLHPLLGCLSIAFALLQVLLAWFANRHSEPAAERVSGAQAQANHDLLDKLRNAEVVEAIGMSRVLQQRWTQHHLNQLEGADTVAQKSAETLALTKFIRYTQQSLTLGAGALLVIQGELSPGAMIAANVLMGRALAPFDQIAGSWKNYLAAKLAYTRLDKLFKANILSEVEFKQPSIHGSIKCENLFILSSDKTYVILNDVNLTINPGEVMVIVGSSGSGKTTLAKALIGAWPDVEGTIYLDNRSIQDWNRLELGLHIGYLPQDIQLFEGTIAENIARLGEVESASVIAAANATGLHQIILRLPKGYDTPIGEAGNLLSGGQRQRLGLARALYGNPQIVVLDEPNANLDDQGELALTNAINLLKSKGSTVILISHRPAALKLADHLISLENGKLNMVEIIN